MKSYFEIFEILVKSLKSCEISWDFEISYVILPRCGPLGTPVVSMVEYVLSVQSCDLKGN